MKIILSEEQFKRIILNEQEDMGAKAFLGPKPGYYSTSSDFVDAHTKWFNETVKLAETPEFWEMMGFAFVFVPVIGIPLSMAAELNAARLYHKKGDDFNAGVTGVLALLPLVGKIPGVKQVTSSFIKGIKNKIKAGTKLIGDEIKYVNSLLKNSKFINDKLFEIRMLIYGIDKEAISKATRILEQKLKMSKGNVDQITKIYQEYIEGLKRIKMGGGGSFMRDIGGVHKKINIDVNQKIGGKKLTKKQIKYVVRHEMDHLYSNTPAEAEDWFKAFDLSRLDNASTLKYFETDFPSKSYNRDAFLSKFSSENQKIYNAWSEKLDIPNFDGNTGKAYSKSFKDNLKNNQGELEKYWIKAGSGPDMKITYKTADELRARAGQLKDFISLKRRIPLKQDFKVTMEDLDYAIKNFVKETGLDNEMTEFITVISDKKKLLTLMNKYALGTAGVTALKSAWDYGYEDDYSSGIKNFSLPNYEMDSAPQSVKNLPTNF